MKTSKIIITIIITLFASLLYGQENKSIRPIVNIGVDVPVGQELSTIYGVGVNSNFYLSFKTIDNFFIGPILNFSYHRKNLNDAAKNQYSNLGAGIALEYLFRTKNSSVSYILGMRGLYESINDKISPRKDFNGSDFKIINGNGIAFGLNFGIELNKFIFQAIYNNRNFDVKFDSSIDNEFTKFNNVYEVFILKDEYKMNLSSLTVSIGYIL